MVKKSACSTGDQGSISGLERSPGEGHGTPVQYSCLENSMDRGTWRAAVHRVSKSRMRLSNSHFDFPSWCRLTCSSVPRIVCKLDVRFGGEHGPREAFVERRIIRSVCFMFRAIQRHGNMSSSAIHGWASRGPLPLGIGGGCCWV